MAENVTEIKAARAAKTAKSTAAAHIRINARMAELVVAGPFFRIGQNIVGFLYFFKLFFGLFIVGIAVGVVLHGQFAVGLFDVAVAGSFGHAQQLVVVLIAHGFFA